ncbi:hypothetical protein ABZY44_17715 [Streptomyces sp. NPDC006544]|uniref:hypothetical protein n=1 Tax=Streptomyces sp. NPDC006544 TaxID=3154583 RepID=UPI0033A11DFF
MITTDSVRTRFIGEDLAQRIADHWNPVYPVMRRTLDTVIKAQRAAERPTVDVAKLELVRRALGQLDRGTFKGCTRSPGYFSVYHALRHVDEVLKVTYSGDPDKGAIYRLAGVLADTNAHTDAAASTYFATERQTDIPRQTVDRSHADKADSGQTERGGR